MRILSPSLEKGHLFTQLGGVVAALRGDAMLTIRPTGDLVSGIVMEAPTADWGHDTEVGGGNPGYAEGQFLAFHQAPGVGDDNNVDSILFRVDHFGSIGMNGGIHLATNLQGGTALGQALWINPANPATHHIVSTGVAGQTGSFLLFTDSTGAVIFTRVNSAGLLEANRSAIIRSAPSTNIAVLKVVKPTGHTGALQTWLATNETTALASIGVNGEVVAAAGTLGAPGITSMADLTTGIRMPGAGLIEFTTSGGKRASISGNGLQVDDGWLAAVSARYGTSLFVQPPAVSDIGQIIRIKDSHTADAFVIQKTTNTPILSRFDKQGRLGLRTTVVPADGDVATGEAVLYVDTTIGAPKIKAKVKDSAGTPSTIDLGASGTGGGSSADLTDTPLYVTHGADAAYLRPSTTRPVVWRGSVEPINSIDGDMWIDTGGTATISDPLKINGLEVRLVYRAANARWEYPSGNIPDLTGRIASITWEGTEAQIPVRGTGDTNFREGDTAIVRSESL